MTTTTTTGSTEGLDGSGTGDSGTTSGAPSSTDASESGVATGATGLDTSGACPDVYAPVCGRDGETYDNACVAAGAGVEIRREGPCVGDCEGSCVVAPRAPSLLALVLVLAFVRPRRRVCTEGGHRADGGAPAGERGVVTAARAAGGLERQNIVS